MTRKEFVESLNILRDRRTVLNFVKLPFIICIRIPVVLIILLAQYIGDNSEVIDDFLPGWKTK
jgi:hypothetical protein